MAEISKSFQVSNGGYLLGKATLRWFIGVDTRLGSIPSPKPGPTTQGLQGPG